MPEGPEIRRAADRVQRALTAAPIRSIYFAFDRLKHAAERLNGRAVTAVETRGKAMLIHFDDAPSIYTHNQLYGRWYVRAAGQYPDTRRQLRLALHNEFKSALLYSASDIEILTPDDLATHPFLCSLGPDVLNASVDQLLAQLVASRFRRRRFAALYLDQKFIAGIGNYLRSEILFLAGLHPSLRACDCDEDALRRLAETTARVARQSYRHNGVTNDLTQARQLRAAGHARSAYRHWVFSRAGLPCRVCGEKIVREDMAGRRLYRCVACQPAPTE